MQGIYNYVPKTNMFLGCIVLQLFSIYSLFYMLCYFARQICFYFYISTFRCMCSVLSISFL